MNNEAIRLAYTALTDIRGATRILPERIVLDLKREEFEAIISALRPLLDQTSAGVGDGGYGIIDAIEWADGVAGALGSEYASRVTDEEIAVAMAIKSALTQADQPADKDDRRALDEKLFRDLVDEAMNDQWSDWCADTGCFPDDFQWKGGNGTLEFTAGKWASHVADQLWNRLKRALSGSDGRE